MHRYNVTVLQLALILPNIRVIAEHILAVLTFDRVSKQLMNPALK